MSEIISRKYEVRKSARSVVGTIAAGLGFSAILAAGAVAGEAVNGGADGVHGRPVWGNGELEVGNVYGTIDEFPIKGFTYSFETDEGDDGVIQCGYMRSVEIGSSDTLTGFADETDLFYGYIDQPLPNTIAIAHGIAEYNGLNDPDKLVLGETIIVPTSCDTPRV